MEKILKILGVVLGIAGIIFALSYFQYPSVAAQCTDAGFDKPAFSLSVTECPIDEDYAFDAIAVVAGNTANSPSPAISTEVSKYLKNTLSDASVKRFAFSAVPSRPSLSWSSKKNGSATNVKTFIAKTNKTIDELAKNISVGPSEDGADYYNAIMSAYNAVAKADNPLIIVIGSGLSDSGPLNFSRNDLLHSDPAIVIEQLVKSGTIAPSKLSGITIVWSGMGTVAAPQITLQDTEVTNLKAIYQKTFEYMGAVVEFDGELPAAQSLETDKTVLQTSTKNPCIETSMAYSEKTLGFTPDAANFLDTNKAKVALSGIVEQYNNNPNMDIKIEGYQARLNGEIETHTTLSENRANAVKNMLVSLGVSGERITAVGRGSSDFDGRVDEAPNGKWDTNLAQKNRVTIISTSNIGVCHE